MSAGDSLHGQILFAYLCASLCVFVCPSACVDIFLHTSSMCLPLCFALSQEAVGKVISDIAASQLSELAATLESVLSAKASDWSVQTANHSAAYALLAPNTSPMRIHRTTNNAHSLVLTTVQ